MTIDINEAKSRLVAAIGNEKTQALENSHVVVIGVGGVGGSCAIALTRSFVGHITVIDADTVETSNLNRQAIAYTQTIGMNKVDAFELIAKQINPYIQIDKRQVFLTSENTQEILDSLVRPDYIVDCIDSMTQKVLIAKWAQDNDIKIVSAMGAAKKFDPTKFCFADIYETKNCPVARVIRKNCRKYNIEKLDVLYSSEQSNEVANKEVLGTISYLPAIMGEMLAGWVISKIAEITW